MSQRSQGALLPLVGSPKANFMWWLRDKTKSISDSSYDKKIKETIYPSPDKVTGAQPLSQASGRCSRKSAWWPSFSLWG